MTAVAEETTTDVDNELELDGDTDATEGESDEDKKARERDFSKFTEKHKELAEFINTHADYVKSGLAPLTPNQVKAAFALRTVFNNTPEVLAARAARKAQLELDKQKYAGLTLEEIKTEKAAKRAENQAAKLQARVQEALDKAKAIREGKDADGAEVAAAVEAAVSEAPSEPEKRTIGRKRG